MPTKVLLSPKQEEVASLKEGAILVCASAGSGKTRVLTERITRLAQITRRKILAITFTNQACDEIKSRLRAESEDLLEKVFVSTFHGFCASIIESQISALGLLEMPQVFSEEDRKKIVEMAINDLPGLKAAFREMPDRDKNFRMSSFLNSVSLAKRNLAEADSDIRKYFNTQDDFSLYMRYQSHMRDLHAYDYDDLLLNAYRLLSENPFVAGLYRRAYEFICVDEAQDMNKAQYYVLRALTGDEHKNVMLVGDPNQSIYAFTGASARYMTEEFVREYAPRQFNLNENYRSARSILDYADKIISQADLYEMVPLQGNVEEYAADSVCDEAEWIAKKIKYLIDAETLPDITEKLDYKDITIIARNSFVLKKIYDKLVEEEIPVEWGLGGKKIEFSSQLGEVMDKALSVRANPYDYLHLNQLSSMFHVSGISTLEELCDMVEDTYYLDVLQKIIALKDDGSDIRSFLIYVHNSLKSMTQHSIPTDEQEVLMADSDVELLMEAWQKYASGTTSRTLTGYRNAIQLGEAQNNIRENKVLVSSVHAMKGKQNKVVFLAGMDDMTFPDYRSMKEGKEAMDQERNNLYVAITRAQRYLYISYPKSRIMPWGEKYKRYRSSLLPMNNYPIHRLNPNINQYLSRIITADIPNCISTGLDNRVQFIDEGTHVTEVSSIFKDPITQKSRVRFSAAYCQFYWLICNVALQLLDRQVILEEFQSRGDVPQYSEFVDFVQNLPIGEVESHMPKDCPINAKSYVDFLQRTRQLFDDDFWDKMNKQFQCAISIIDSQKTIDWDVLEQVNLNGEYEEKTNSIYVYGISYLMLHELSHHALGHLSRGNRSGDEDDADMSAFWCVFNDISDEHRFSAIASIICVFFSFMILDPALNEDGEHSRDDIRLFAIYDQVKDENSKYTQLLVGLLDFWAKVFCIKDYPVNLPSNDESIKKIRNFFSCNCPAQSRL